MKFHSLPRQHLLAVGSRPPNFWHGLILSLSLSWGQVSISLGPLIEDPQILSGWLDYKPDYTSNDCLLQNAKENLCSFWKDWLKSSWYIFAPQSPHRQSSNMVPASSSCPRLSLWNSIFSDHCHSGSQQSSQKTKALQLGEPASQEASQGPAIVTSQVLAGGYQPVKVSPFTPDNLSRYLHIIF